MTTEADVKRMISKSVTDAGGYARRIEDAYSVGIFDMLLIPVGLPVFAAEVKMVHRNVFGPTPRQMIELVRIDAAANGKGHVIPVMIGYREGVFYFHKPQIRIQIQDCFSVPTKMQFYDQLVNYYHHIVGKKHESKHTA